MFTDSNQDSVSMMLAKMVGSIALDATDPDLQFERNLATPQGVACTMFMVRGVRLYQDETIAEVLEHLSNMKLAVGAVFPRKQAKAIGAWLKAYIKELNRICRTYPAPTEADLDALRRDRRGA